MLYTHGQIINAIKDIIRNKYKIDFKTYIKNKQIDVDEALINIFRSLHKWQIFETVEKNYSFYWKIIEINPEVWSGFIKLELIETDKE
jgi:hypothetical protein